MRYLLVRRNARISLLVILLAASLAISVQRILKNVFMDDQSRFTHKNYEFSSYFQDIDAEKDISLDIHFLNNNYGYSKLAIEDFNLKGSLISADIIVKGQIIKDVQANSILFSGKVSVRNIKVNSEPLPSLGAAFKLREDRLEIESLRFGRSYRLEGYLALREPFETNLRLEVNRADIRELAPVIKIKNPKIEPGIINAVFNIKGTLKRLFSDGILESKNGRLGYIRYNLANLKLEGFGPIINIVDSNIKYGETILIVEGYLDLRDINKRTLFDGLRVKSADMKTIAWDSWDIEKKGRDELSITKDVSDNMCVGFKTVAREPVTPYRDRENPEEMSLEYKIGSKNLKMKLKENEEFFGIEHSVEF